MIKLELMERDDLIKVVQWNENKSADDLLQWAGPVYSYPLTLAQVENFYLNEVKKENSNIYAYKILLTETGAAIGTIEIRITDEENKIGKVGRFLIGEESIRGKGIGTKVLREVVRMGFEEFKLNKITLGVFDFNEGAIKCYEKVGFKKVKFIENARKSSNSYWNLFEMAILKDEWPSIN